MTRLLQKETLTISDEIISGDEMKTLLTAIVKPIEKNSPLMSGGVKIESAHPTSQATSSSENAIIEDSSSQPFQVYFIRFLRCQFVENTFDDFQKLINATPVVNIEFDSTNQTLEHTLKIMSASITSKHNINIWFNCLAIDPIMGVTISRLIDFTVYLQMHWNQWCIKIVNPVDDTVAVEDTPEKDLSASYLAIIQSISLYQLQLFHLFLSYFKLKQNNKHPRIDLELLAYENTARGIIVEIRDLKSKLGNLAEDYHNTFKQTLDELEKDLQLFLPSQLEPNIFLNDRIAYYCILCHYLWNRYRMMHQLQHKDLNPERLDTLIFNETIVEYGTIYTSLMGATLKEGMVDHCFFYNSSIARQTIHTSLYALFRGFIVNFIAQPHVDNKIPVSTLATDNVLFFHQPHREIDFINSLERIHFAKLSSTALYDIGYAIILTILSIYQSTTNHDLATSKQLVTIAFAALNKVLTLNSTSIVSKLLFNWLLHNYFSHRDANHTNNDKIKIFIDTKLLKFFNTHRAPPSPLQKTSASTDGYYVRQRFAIENLACVYNLRFTMRQMPTVADKLEHQKVLFAKIIEHLPDPSMLGENYLKYLAMPTAVPGCYYLDGFTPMTRFCLFTVTSHCFAVINTMKEVFDYLIVWVSEERQKHVSTLPKNEQKSHFDNMKTWCNYLQAWHEILAFALNTLKAQCENTITAYAARVQNERRALLDKAVTGLNKPIEVATSATSATSSTAAVIQSLPKVVANPKSPITRIQYQPSHIELLSLLTAHYGAENVKVHGSYLTAQVLLQLFGLVAPYNDLDIFIMSNNPTEDSVKLKSILPEFNPNMQSSVSAELEISNGIFKGALADISFVGPACARTPGDFINKASTDYKLLFADSDGTLHDVTKQSLPALKNKQQKLHNVESPICMLHHAIGEIVYGFSSTKKDIAHIAENVSALKTVSKNDLLMCTLKLFYQKKAEKAFKLLMERGYLAVLMPELLTKDKVTLNQYIAYCKTLDSTYHNYRAETIADLLVGLYHIAINKSWHNAGKGVPLLRPIILSTITRSKGLLLSSLTEEVKLYICTEIGKKFGITEALEPIEARLKVNGNAATIIANCEFVPKSLDVLRPKGP